MLTEMVRDPFAIHYHNNNEKEPRFNLECRVRNHFTRSALCRTLNCSINYNHRYKVEDVYEIVAKVELYPEFVPWCVATKEVFPDKNKEPNVKYYEMTVGFQSVSQSYTSKVTMVPNESVIVTLLHFG